MPGQRQLEADPSLPNVDENGEQLLKHAKVYTLAEKLQVPQLKSLSHSKIHCVNSTAKGEIAYARYVYACTSKDDVIIREPVAHFWAMRSHTLRAEAEDEFRTLCLEYPQFGYDVLSESPFLLHCAAALCGLRLTVGSACSGRQAQARAEREDAPGQQRKRPQTSSSQQQCLGPVS